MKQFCTRMALIALCLTAAMPTLAQTSADPTTQTQAQTPSTGQRRHHGNGRMRALGLSKDQRRQIREIRKTTAKGKERRRAIMAVLTPDQQTKYMAMRGGHRRNQQQ